MHTAFELKSSMFGIKINGASVGRDDLLDWDVRDRLGVVISRPFGAVGAAMLIQLAITAYYDMPSRKRRMQPNYPDIFLFHSGGPWGNHSSFDFWPDHKEVFVEPGPLEMLRAINNRGITHLAVPEQATNKVVHRFKEAEAAADRIKQCFIYGPDGTVDGADVTIETTDPKALRNIELVLHPERMNERKPEEALAVQASTLLKMTPPEEVALFLVHHGRREYEVSGDDPCRLRAARRLQNALEAGRLVEQLRRTTVETVLDMLG